MNAEGTYDESAAALGLAEATSSRGVVCADFDSDGDTDILELTDAPGNSARLWENRTAAAGPCLRVRSNAALGIVYSSGTKTVTARRSCRSRLLARRSQQEVS